MDDGLLLICGEETYLVDEALREWRARAATGEVPLEVFDQPSKLGPLAMSIAELPLFDPERCIIVRDPPQLAGQAKKGADSAEGLAELLSRRAPTTALCIVNHAAIPPANPVRAAVLALGGRISEYPRLKGGDLVAFAQRINRESNAGLDRRAIDHVVQNAGPSLGAIAQTIAKLATCADGGDLSNDDVRALVPVDWQVRIWDVIDLLVGPAPGRGAAAVDALLEDGVAPVYLLATLAGQVRDLVAIRALISRKEATPATVTATLRIPPWRATKLIDQARGLRGPMLVGWLRELHRLDQAIKSGDATDADVLRAFIRSAAAEVAGGRGVRTAV